MNILVAAVAVASLAVAVLIGLWAKSRWIDVGDDERWLGL